MLKVNHLITNKEESFRRKGLASIIANMVHIMKRCYNRISSIKNKDTTAGHLMHAADQVADGCILAEAPQLVLISWWVMLLLHIDTLSALRQAF